MAQQGLRLIAMRIALFITCVNDTFFPQTGRATVALLERLGHTVLFPEQQTCCGQIHANSGYRPEALELARSLVATFEDCQADAIVCPSGSCAAMITHEYPSLAQQAGDVELMSAVDALVPRVFELSQFLVDELALEDVGAYFPHRVTYHPSCHSLRLLNVGDRPLRLLRAVRGIDLVELPRATTCCGFGGTFATKNSEVSSAMLADKLSNIESTQATVCTATDNSCLLHIGGGLSRDGARARPVHLAEILASTDGRQEVS